MNKKEIISKTETFVRERMQEYDPAHDWMHVDRVRNLALRIAKHEDGDAFIIELTALLHDVLDFKLFKGKKVEGERLVTDVLISAGADAETSNKVVDVIQRVSFKGSGVKDDMPYLEGKIVQDADRLDALGAIGIARCFYVGAQRETPIYDPNIKPVTHESFEMYKSYKGTSINHFYEKVLLLKDRMHTDTAKKIAEGRHAFIETYLEQFLAEWDGER